jgi:hypothetical protein
MPVIHLWFTYDWADHLFQVMTSLWTSTYNLVLMIYFKLEYLWLDDLNWGCPADLLTNHPEPETDLDPKVHWHTSRAPQVGIDSEPTDLLRIYISYLYFA